MLSRAFVDELTGLANVAKPTQDQSLALLEGWSVYFTKLQIPDQEHLTEFRGIMRARVQAGCVSIVAPDLTGDDVFRPGS